MFNYAQVMVYSYFLYVKNENSGGMFTVFFSNNGGGGEFVLKLKAKFNVIDKHVKIYLHEKSHLNH